MFKKIISFLFIFILSFSFSFGADSDLKITDFVVNSTKEVKLTFNLALNPDSQREFKLVNKNDNLDEITIDSSELIGENEVVLNLGSELKSNSKYDLTVVSITGANGETIKAGADGIVTITTPEDINSNQNQTQQEDVELNSGGEEPIVTANSGNTENTTSDSIKTLGGETIVSTGTVITATATNALPKTGTSEIILLLIALFISGTYTFYKMKKS